MLNALTDGKENKTRKNFFILSSYFHFFLLLLFKVIQYFIKFSCSRCCCCFFQHCCDKRGGISLNRKWHMTSLFVYFILLFSLNQTHTEKNSIRNEICQTSKHTMASNRQNEDINLMFSHQFSSMLRSSFSFFSMNR